MEKGRVPGQPKKMLQVIDVTQMPKKTPKNQPKRTKKQLNTTSVMMPKFWKDGFNVWVSEQTPSNWGKSHSQSS